MYSFPHFNYYNNISPIMYLVRILRRDNPHMFTEYVRQYKGNKITYWLEHESPSDITVYYIQERYADRNIPGVGAG
jgi:hypothetical protein